MIKNKEEKKALVNLLTFLHEKGFTQEEAMYLWHLATKYFMLVSTEVCVDTFKKIKSENE